MARIRRVRGGTARLLCPAIKSRRYITPFADRFIKAGRRSRKRRKPQDAGPTRRLMGHFTKRCVIRRPRPDPGQVPLKIRAKHAQPGQRVRVSEDGAGFGKRLRILNARRCLFDRFAFHHAVHFAPIQHPYQDMKENIMKKYPKYCVPVKATLENGTQYFGGIHVSQNQRILDVLCDERAFIPFKLRDKTILLNKSWLVQIDLLELAEISEMENILPEVNLDYLNANTW